LPWRKGGREKGREGGKEGEWVSVEEKRRRPKVGAIRQSGCEMGNSANIGREGEREGGREGTLTITSFSTCILSKTFFIVSLRFNRSPNSLYALSLSFRTFLS